MVFGAIKVSSIEFNICSKEHITSSSSANLLRSAITKCRNYLLVMSPITGQVSPKSEKKPFTIIGICTL